jgi:nicotinamide-nucleotide amidase
MRGEIITIGDELITGRVLDQNAFFLSGRLSSHGLTVTNVTCVGDDEASILDALAAATARSDFVLVSGGLGPTDDDITARAAARFFETQLVLDREYLDTIRRSVTGRGLAWVDSYRKLAYLPQGSEVIDPDGDACGFLQRKSEVPVFFLPGVPDEVRRLTEEKVLPRLVSAMTGDAVRQRVFKLFGAQEAQIGEALAGLGENRPGVLIGYYPNFPEIHVTLTVQASTAERADLLVSELETEIEHRLGQWVVAQGAETIEGAVGRMLTDRGLTLALAESCTGGLIGHRITQVSGSSAYFDRGLVVYSNRAKQSLLGVSADTLDRHGAVSGPCAEEMAEGARKNAGADLGLATTGVAGPTGGSPEKPVGTVYIALASDRGARSEKFHFPGTRAQVKTLTAETALSLLKRRLADDTLLFRD